MRTSGPLNITPTGTFGNPDFTVVATLSALPAGSYEIAWEGLGPPAQVRILKHGNPVVTAAATIVAIGKNAPANTTAWRTNPDGSFSLELLQFKDRNFALRFEP